jgi:RNA 3'-terminal phosphate cyclase (ATP)
VQARISPLSEPLPAIKLKDRGALTRVWGRAFVAGKLSDSHARALRDGAAAELIREGYDAELRVERARDEQEPSHASGILLFAETETGCIFGASRLGSREHRDEDLGREAAEELVRCLNSGACVDEWTQVSGFLKLSKSYKLLRTGFRTR